MYLLVPSTVSIAVFIVVASMMGGEQCTCTNSERSTCRTTCEHRNSELLREFLRNQMFCVKHRRCQDCEDNQDAEVTHVGVEVS